MRCSKRDLYSMISSALSLVLGRRNFGWPRSHMGAMPRYGCLTSSEQDAMRDDVDTSM
jgi:hypothetical protein